MQCLQSLGHPRAQAAARVEGVVPLQALPACGCAGRALAHSAAHAGGCRWVGWVRGRCVALACARESSELAAPSRLVVALEALPLAVAAAAAGLVASTAGLVTAAAAAPATLVAAAATAPALVAAATAAALVAA
eukprot:CAMPEP_0179935436 /NCGR_PEP_ID=MMETSP0983-20121128/13084_1 /TAXON_ID=483367 /ORGANISM="non described non described, Strain CCMP 2436" /LENGTH=133 /DNA_ID=CAMNT_0021840675 /DNA_START=265 /DNA_END=662 /DNA_ORIENTATION=-